jgi:hypothetical protein
MVIMAKWWGPNRFPFWGLIPHQRANALAKHEISKWHPDQPISCLTTIINWQNLMVCRCQMSCQKHCRGDQGDESHTTGMTWTE